MKRQINKNFRFINKSYTEQEYNDKGELIKGKRGVVLEGSSRCFHSNQLVITDSGAKKISETTTSDKVLSYNEAEDRSEFKKVIDTLRFSNKKPSVKITLKNGTVIKCTLDHEFYYKGAWTSIKHLLSLRDENNRNMEAYTKL